jgi:hypothetical protein
LDPDMDLPADFADRDRQIEATAKWLGGDYANTGQSVPQLTPGVRHLHPSVVPTEVSGAAGESEVDQEDAVSGPKAAIMQVCGPFIGARR